MPGLSRDHIIWAYRLLLDREPESEAVITPKMQGYGSTVELRRDFMTSAEFAEKNGDLAQTNDRTIVIRPLESGLRIFADLADQAIGLNVIRGRFERAELAFACRAVAPGQVAVDCGAHIGLFALHMARQAGPGGHVHAFEPFPGNAELLELSVAENRFVDRVSVERAAVGEAAGTAEINFATHTFNSGGAFLLTAGAESLPGHARLAVRVVALDSYPLRRPVSFIKLDIEGAELLALRGAERLLAEDRPALLCEIHYEQLARVSRTTPEQLFGYLAGFGYRAHGIDPDGALGPGLAHAPTAPVSTVAFVYAGQNR